MFPSVSITECVIVLACVNTKYVAKSSEKKGQKIFSVGLLCTYTSTRYSYTFISCNPLISFLRTKVLYLFTNEEIVETWRIYPLNEFWNQEWSSIASNPRVLGSFQKAAWLYCHSTLSSYREEAHLIVQVWHNVSVILYIEIPLQF